MAPSPRPAESTIMGCVIGTGPLEAEVCRWSRGPSPSGSPQPPRHPPACPPAAKSPDNPHPLPLVPHERTSRRREASNWAKLSTYRHLPEVGLRPDQLESDGRKHGLGLGHGHASQSPFLRRRSRSDRHRYWTASAMCVARTSSLPAKSATVRATRRMIPRDRTDSPRRSNAVSSNFCPFRSGWQHSGRADGRRWALSTPGERSSCRPRA